MWPGGKGERVWPGGKGERVWPGSKGKRVWPGGKGERVACLHYEHGPNNGNFLQSTTYNTVEPTILNFWNIFCSAVMDGRM